jgi:hypothetical protein
VFTDNDKQIAAGRYSQLEKRKSTTAFYSHNFRLRWAKAQHGTSFTAAATLQRALVSWRRQCCELPKYALTLRVARSRGLVQ